MSIANEIPWVGRVRASSTEIGRFVPEFGIKASSASVEASYMSMPDLGNRVGAKSQEEKWVHWDHEVETVDSAQNLFVSRSQRRHVASIPGLDFKVMRYSCFEWSGGSLVLSHVQGALVNATVVPPDQVFVALNASGWAKVSTNGIESELEPGGSFVALPGDLLVQTIRDLVSYTIRLPIRNRLLFRVSAQPFRVRKSIPRRLALNASQDVLSLCRFMRNESRRAQATDSHADQLDAIGAAIDARVSHLVASLFSLLQAESDPMFETCLRSVDFLRRNLHRSISIEEMAEAAGCSARSLYRAFRFASLTTPADYAVRLRVSHGRSLLLESPQNPRTNEELARLCGFSSARTFANAYRAEFGESPGRTLEHFNSSVLSN